MSEQENDIQSLIDRIKTGTSTVDDGDTVALIIRLFCDHLRALQHIAIYGESASARIAIFAIGGRLDEVIDAEKAEELMV